MATNQPVPTPAEPAKASSAAATANPDTVAALIELRNAFAARLNEIAARACRFSNQASADLVRAASEAQFNVHVAQQGRFLDYVAAVQNAAVRAVPPSGLNERAANCAKDIEAAHGAARKSVDDAQTAVASRLKEANDAANRDWDEACTRYVAALGDQLAKGLARGLQPNAVALIGQHLMDVAAQLRGQPQT